MKSINLLWVMSRIWPARSSKYVCACNVTPETDVTSFEAKIEPSYCKSDQGKNSGPSLEDEVKLRESDELFLTETDTVPTPST